MLEFSKELFNDISVLYVEDDQMTLDEIEFFLKRYVKNLYIAKNGQEGLELFKKYKPNIIITDIQMPIMNGLVMAEKVFEIDPSIPIVVTTAFSESDYIIKAIELGIDKYILKPLNMQELLAIIHKSLYLEKLQKENSNYEDYIHFILDSNPTFMFVMHSNEIEYVNKKLLNLLGLDNIESLKEQLKNNNSLVEFGEDINMSNWLEYISANSHKRHLVKLKNAKNNKFFQREFYISYRYFKNMDKSVFIFIDKNEEKLEQINNVTLKLIKNLEVGISNEFLMDELKKILDISTRS